MALLKLTSVVAVVLLAACERTPAEIVLSQQSYAVHVVVEADSNAVMALPTSTSPDAQTVAVPALMHISMDDGAHVVFLPVDQVTCRGTAGCYRAAIHVASGARFIVDGQIDNGPSFEGSTVVPQPPVIVSPASGAVISLSCTTVQACIGSAFSPAVGIVELNMNSDSSAARIEVRVIADSVPGVAGASCMIDYPAVTLTDGANQHHVTLPIRSVQCTKNGASVNWAAIDAHIHVLGFDANYANYQTTVVERDRIIPDSAGVGIRGVGGVVGSVARSVVPIRLVRAGG